MEPDEPADRIRERMAELRSDLSWDVRDVGRSARAMTDVGLYVRRFPWATIAVAMAAGYLLVPRKRHEFQPDPALIAKLIEQKQLRVEASPKESSPKSALKSLAVMALMTAARTGMNAVAQRLAATSAAPFGTSEAAAPSHETFS